MRHEKRQSPQFWRVMILLGVCFVVASNVGYAKSAKEIDSRVDVALEKLQKEVIGSSDLLHKAKGVLVLPKVIKGGIGLGAEYGEGALRIGGKTAGYYRLIGGSLGFQLGGQVKNVYLLFMEDAALNDFKTSDGWKMGADASVALISVGANGSIDTMKTNEPIVAFVIGQKGLMYNLTLEGAKVSKISKA
jgi:lipid-binding SYLF domain-containing protein